MTRAATIAVTFASLVGVAAADKQASREHYLAGKAAYTSGHFDIAVVEFQHAYREQPAPEYLQDIAQASRHLGRCGDAIEYLQRYLAASPDAPHRDELEAQLAELRASCPARHEPAPKDPVPHDPTPVMPSDASTAD